MNKKRIISINERTMKVQQKKERNKNRTKITCISYVKQ